MTSEPSAQSQSSRTPILIGAIVLMLGTAGYFTWRNTTGKIEQPDTADSAAPCMCADCGATFTLTPAGYSKLSKEGGVKYGGDDRTGAAKIRCPKCGKFEGGSALQCPKDQTIFPLVEKGGKSSKCPKCGWQP